jgi:hypothetical protein
LIIKLVLYHIQEAGRPTSCCGQDTGDQTGNADGDPERLTNQQLRFSLLFFLGYSIFAVEN